jgi:SAM-dependent methyltransferase
MDGIMSDTDVGPTAPSGLPASTAGYAEAAEQLGHRYESVAFEAVHADILHLLPTAPVQVLDVGAGTGRDAAALAGRGHRVTAAEPVPELRAVARRIHADATVDWVDACLPELTPLTGRFDLILVNAVWMHLDLPERQRSMVRVAELLAPGGQAVITLRHGPVPAGRRMFDVHPAETLAQAEEQGLDGVLLGADGADHLGRGDVHWSTLVLRNDRRTA